MQPPKTHFSTFSKVQKQKKSDTQIMKITHSNLDSQLINIIIPHYNIGNRCLVLILVHKLFLLPSPYRNCNIFVTFRFGRSAPTMQADITQSMGMTQVTRIILGQD